MTLDRTFQTHLKHSWPLTSTMKKTWMPDLTGEDRASHQQIPAAVGEAREKGLQGQDLATLLSKGQLAPCL